MRKKLTITIEEDVYAALYNVAGPRNIGQFIEDLVRPHVMERNLEREYEEMARREEGEREAREWSEAVIGDIADEAG